MDSENKDGDSDSRESHGLKISEFLKALAERKSPPCDTTHIDPRNISTTLSILKNSHGTFRSRAVLHENISQLSKRQFQRRDHLSESLPVPNTAVASSQEGQLHPTLPSSNPVVLTHLLEKSKTLPSASALFVVERFKKQEIHPHILDVQAWTKQLSCEPQWMPPKMPPQTGPTNQWFFENLTDLQRKLFLGASKKHGVPRHYQMPVKSARHNSSESTSLPLPPL
ncbi:uncharacterized protein LOC130169397 isoform X2 [Seriola aureovittata]|uniref:uncharacterized protein LOC130169397 isoform X2 n=1 Tax=Seriola aureovittata TaxID=2871759 RepID=UPI0024BD61B7|nr:uncharacterized protein LOC130169397 isoform X2 [Seriola aureovittata]